MIQGGKLCLPQAFGFLMTTLLLLISREKGQIR